MEQMRYNLLFGWFVGLAMDDAVWDHSVFSKNRDRLLAHEIVEAFFTEVMTLADQAGLLSKEHFPVDGTLIQAWASHKSFVPKDGADDQTRQGGGRHAQADWKGKPRSNDTHASTTDPDAGLYKKSDKMPAMLCCQGHVLLENRSGLVVGAPVSHADGTGERMHALRMLDCVPGCHAKTIGADKAYDTADFVADCRTRKATPRGGSAIDGRTSRHRGYGVSPSIRARIEDHSGWGKTVGRIRQTVYRGLHAVDQQFKLTMSAGNLKRMARILVAVRKERSNEASEGGQRIGLRENAPQ
jgi:hypothetical protein